MTPLSNGGTALAKTIDGELFKNMMIEGAAAVDARKEEINDLNVFPVPDGDTGIARPPWARPST